MINPVHRFRIPGAVWTLEFSPSAIAAFQRHSQRGWWKREAVGQLFSSDLTGETVLVETATKLSPIWSGFHGVQFNTREAAAERNEYFARGLHCLGFWHTHPEPIPSPSPTDRQLIAEHAQAARPTLAGLAFVIVGTAPFPSGLGVWVHDGQREWEAKPL